MDDKYFELADTLLEMFFEKRHNPFSTFPVLLSNKFPDKILLRKVLSDFKSFGIITTSPSTTKVEDRIELTSIGLTVSQKQGAYRQFVEGQTTNNSMIKKDHLTGDITITTGSAPLIIKSGDVTGRGNSGAVSISTGHGSIDNSYIGDKIQDSSLRNFKSNEVVTTNPPIKNPNATKSIWVKLLHSWWTYFIGVLVALTALAIEHDWFNIVKTK